MKPTDVLTQQPAEAMTAVAPIRLAGPMPCVQCQYDLRNLGPDQRCPECGTEIGETLASPAAAGSADLQRLRRGLMLIAIAMIVGTAWIMVGQFLVLFLAFGSMGGVGSSIPMLVIMSIVPAISMLLAVMSAMGWSRIMGSMGSMYPDRAKSAQRVKQLAWAFAILYLVSAVGLIGMQVRGVDTPEMTVLITGMVIVTFATWTVRTALGFGLLARVARSARAIRTARVLRALAWATIGLPVIIVGSTMGGELLGLESLAGIYLEYIVGGATLLLGLAIISLGVVSLVVRATLAPFARAAALRPQMGC